MCSCLAIINMSYSRADRQSEARSHFFFVFILYKLLMGKERQNERKANRLLIYGLYIFSDLSVTVKLHCVVERDLLTQVLWVAAQNDALYISCFFSMKPNESDKYCRSKFKCTDDGTSSVFILMVIRSFLDGGWGDHLQEPTLTFSPTTAKANYYANGALVDSDLSEVV